MIEFSTTQGNFKLRHSIAARAVSVAIASAALVSLPEVKTEAMTHAQNQAPLTLKPFKDELFGHKALISESHDGLLKIYDYNEKRDIDLRDAIPVKRANTAYVTAISENEQREFNLTISSKDGRKVLPTFEVGRSSKARFAVIFIHGANGTRDLGVNDWTFSGNFNRLKHLAIQNGGVYYSPTVRELMSPKGADEILSLMIHIKKTSPEAPIVLACASSGAFVCSNIAKSSDASELLAGMMLMGTSSDATVLRSPLLQNRVPVLFTQGTKDSLASFAGQVAHFESILKMDPNYPTAFVGFHTGGHGVPIRMLDWREALNWIFSVRP